MLLYCFTSLSVVYLSGARFTKNLTPHLWQRSTYAGLTPSLWIASD